MSCELQPGADRDRPTRKLCIAGIGLLLCGALAASGCRGPDPRTGAIFGAARAARPPPAAVVQGRAHLRIIALDVSPSAVRRRQPFSVAVRVQNEGDQLSGNFEVEAQANLETPTGVVSYRIEGRDEMGLKPGEVVELKLTKAEGLNRTGTYIVTAAIQPVEGILDNAVADWISKQTPEARLRVD